MRATPPPNQDRRSRPRRRRGAFSLIEVILALAILCGALATLGELSRLGMREAEKARDLTQAQLLCESKLSEITAGVTPLEAQEDAPFESTDEEDSESEWVYSIAVTPLDEEGLTEVRVTVRRDLPSGRRTAEFSLVRWVVDEGEGL